MTWTVQRTATLRTLWADGLSASQIAAELGGFPNCADAGRSAVIGKVHRLGLPGRGNRIANPRAAEIREERRRARRAGQLAPAGFRYAIKPRGPNRAVTLRDRTERQAIADELAAQFATETTADLTLEQRAKTVTFFQITDKTCRYPLGDPAKPDFCFCGDTPAPDKPYCTPHWRLAHQRYLSG